MQILITGINDITSLLGMDWLNLIQQFERTEQMKITNQKRNE